MQKESIMSAEHAKAVIERMKSDIAFKVHILSIKDVDEKIKYINSEGFICSVEEIREAEIDAHSSTGEQRGGYWFPFSFAVRHHL